MKDANDWEEAYLLELITVGEQESLTLDYKASAALAKTDKCRSDLSKDVSAFANSAGGFLVYGMLENGHVPTAVDVGLDRNIITKEWLESVIKSVIQSVVDDVVIKQIDLPSRGTDKVAYAVQIAQATSRAPHQAKDYRYYKRFNFESTPMEDYEVRDLMRRSIEYGKKYGAAWDLNVEIQRL
jgi:predicted HTH transcriptional regulator